MSGEPDTDLVELLKAGDSAVLSNVREIVITINEDDLPEVAQAKGNIQFVLNSASDAVAMLSYMAKETGNPKYFDSLSSMLRIMNEGNAQLINLSRNIEKATNQSFNNKGGVVNHNTVNLSTEEVQMLASGGKTMTEIISSGNVKT